MLDRAALADDLIRDEGMRQKPYRDSVGKLTIGIGRNLDDRGLSNDECLELLSNDIDLAVSELTAVLPEWRLLDEPRGRALVNMMFNLGRPKFCEFTRMIAAIRRHDFEEAAREAKDSKWAKQVGTRAVRIAAALEGK